MTICRGVYLVLIIFEFDMQPKYIENNNVHIECKVTQIVHGGMSMLPCTF
jgi:hypothetical protein